MIDNIHTQKQSFLALINFCLHLGEINLMGKEKMKFHGECLLNEMFTVLLGRVYKERMWYI